MAEAKEPSLQGLNALVGEWDTEATHPMVPSTVVHGHSVFEWLEREKFLIVRARLDHSEQIVCYLTNYPSPFRDPCAGGMR
jgi:hypothetical protein